MINFLAVSADLLEPIPLEVGKLGNFNARMLRNFHAAVDDWDEVCSALRPWEAEHLTKEVPGSAGEQHWRGLIELLAWGRVVQRATEQPEFPEQSVAACVKARIRHLEDKLALWHGEMTPAEEDCIVQAAFS